MEKRGRVLFFPPFFKQARIGKVVHMTLQVPTILIGLGGIGSTVTHQIYERLPEERRKK